MKSVLIFVQAFYFYQTLPYKVFFNQKFQRSLYILDFLQANFISCQLQNFQAMSKYKTPIRIHIESIKKINQQTSKYKLPFGKDEPSKQLTFSLNGLEMQTFVGSQQKPIQQKQLNEQKRSMREQLLEQETSSLQSVKQISQREISTEDKVEQIKVTLVNQQSQLIQKVESKIPTSKNSQLKLQPIHNQTRSNFKNSVETELTYRNQIKSKPLNPKPNYHSSTNRYTYTEQQQNLADRSRQSELHQTEIDAKMNNSNNRNIPWVNRRQKQNKQLHNSLKKVQRQVWQILAKSIEKQELEQNEVNLKKLRSKLKRSISKVSQSENNESKLIAHKLKKLVLEKEQQEVNNYNQNMYDQLPPIHEDSQLSQIAKEQADSVIKKLHQIILLQQSSKKNKNAVPLQKYRKQHQWIRKVNPFFKKLNELGGCVMLSIGKIKFLDAGDLLFTQGEPISHLAIIILGKVVLTKAYNHFKNYGLPGESLGQQALFDESKPYNHRLSNNPRPIFYKMQARAHNRMCILRINLRKFYKMSIQLNTIGQKRLFNLIDNLFKINYLKKNALLHQQVKERLQTQILVTRRKRKSSFFHH